MVHVTIYENRIAQMNGPSGGVGRYLRGKAQDIEMVAKSLVHSRSGRLARSIHRTAGPFDSRGATMTIGTNVYYSHWVHDGTLGMLIVPTRAPVMVLPPYGPYGEKRMKRVSGQAANPFLADAVEDVMGHSKFLGDG